MPSLTTHTIFGKEVYKKMPDKTKDIIKDSFPIYNIFNQSHDILYCYSFDPKNSKRIKRIAFEAHHYYTKDFIINIVKYIKEHKLENNSDAIAYLYGTINHYVLDTICHPYIFYTTGVYRKHQKWTHKYKGLHTLMEKDIDALYYEKYNKKKYYYCNLNKESVTNITLSKTVLDIIDEAFKKTYDKDNVGIYYQKGIKQWRLINFFVVQDFLGIKRFLYLIFDAITFHKFGYISSYSTHLTNPNRKWLNEEHKEWNHPCIKEEKYTYSFDDLFNQSIDKSLNIVKQINEVLYDNKDIKTLDKVIENTDYATGLDCDDPRELQYFAEIKN